MSSLFITPDDSKPGTFGRETNGLERLSQVIDTRRPAAVAFCRVSRYETGRFPGPATGDLPYAPVHRGGPCMALAPHHHTSRTPHG